MIRTDAMTLPLLVVVLALAAAVSAQAQIPGLPSAPSPAGEAEERPAGPVEVESSPAEDRALARRLREIYGSIQALAGVRVEVRSGVVRLSGEVLSGEAREQAETIARQLRGVVEVENELAEVRDLDRRLGAVSDNLRQRLTGFVVSLPLVGVALAVVALFWLAGGLLTRWDWPFRRLTGNRFVADLARHALRAVLLLAGLLLALEVLDATAVVAAVAGAAGLAGLAVGFAFRDLVENYIASVLLSLRQPFLPHDHVVIEGHEGRVARLTSRATVLITLDGNHVRIPNADVFKGVIVNYSRNPKRRFDFVLGVGSGEDLGRAQSTGLATLRAMPGILADPPPQAWIDEIGESAVLVHFFAWIDQRGVEWAKVRGEAIRRVKEAFDAAGIELPEPIHRLRLERRRPAAPERRAAPSAAAPAPPDLSRDTHLDREVAEERAAAPEESDLLDPRAPTE
ncbi:MAG TPA: mechanosensitive ion channel domain-containing protein [Thermoanaerobaculia bacterium]